MDTIIAIKELIDDKVYCIHTISLQVNYSVVHMRRIFKRETGITLYQYIKIERLRSSLLLLQKPSVSILESSLEAGFQYEQNYIRAFKQVYGLPPGEYRKLKLIKYDKNERIRACIIK